MIHIPNYKFIGKHRTNKKGGGVGLLVHDGLQFRARNDIRLDYDSELEYQFIELKSRKEYIGGEHVQTTSVKGKGISKRLQKTDRDYETP